MDAIWLANGIGLDSDRRLRHSGPSDGEASGRIHMELLAYGWLCSLRDDPGCIRRYLLPTKESRFRVPSRRASPPQARSTLDDTARNSAQYTPCVCQATHRRSRLSFASSRMGHGGKTTLVFARLGSSICYVDRSLLRNYDLRSRLLSIRWSCQSASRSEGVSHRTRRYRNRTLHRSFGHRSVSRVNERTPNNASGIIWQAPFRSPARDSPFRESRRAADRRQYAR